jgi:hypothetical protein
LKKHDNSAEKSEPTSRRAKSRGPVQSGYQKSAGGTGGKAKEKLDPKRVAARSGGEERERGEPRPTLEGLTAAVDLGDRWSHYRTLGLGGRKVVLSLSAGVRSGIKAVYNQRFSARVVVAGSCCIQFLAQRN